jgi:hypothetical protein
MVCQMYHHPGAYRGQKKGADPFIKRVLTPLFGPEQVFLPVQESHGVGVIVLFGLLGRAGMCDKHQEGQRHFQ